MTPPPVIDKPVADKPIPAIAKPAEEKPVETKATEEKPAEVKAAESKTVTPPPVLDDITAPPPAPDMDFMADSAPDIPAPSDDDVPEEVTQEDLPDAAELSKTQPTSPNLHKAFSSEHVSEGQNTNLAKAAREPEVRVPDMPNDILMPDDVPSPAKAPAKAPVSNLQKVIHGNGGDAFSAARSEFLDYLKKDYTFEYMYMCDCKLTWEDQTVWCIMPDSFSQSIDDIRGNPIIMTHLLSICQKHEPSLLHVNVVTQQAFDTKDSSGSGDGATGTPERPDWVKAVEKVSEENGIPLTHVKDM